MEREARPDATDADREVVAHHREVDAVAQEHARDARVAVRRELHDDRDDRDDDAEHGRHHRRERGERLADGDGIEREEVRSVSVRADVVGVEGEERTERDGREDRDRDEPTSQAVFLVHGPAPRPLSGT